MAAREGIDVNDVNRLTRHYRETFHTEMPHPKMDALVSSLSKAWTNGKKALVFVRRVRSVDERKRKLDEKYDEWLIPALRERLPEKARSRYDEIVARYRAEKREAADARTTRASQARDAVDSGDETRLEDTGGTDTFFAWFFRGEGPPGLVSWRQCSAAVHPERTAYSTFFEDNHVAVPAWQSTPESVIRWLAPALGLDSRRPAPRASTYVSVRGPSARARRHPSAAIGSRPSKPPLLELLDGAAGRRGHSGEGTH